MCLRSGGRGERERSAERGDGVEENKGFTPVLSVMIFERKS